MCSDEFSEAFGSIDAKGDMQLSNAQEQEEAFGGGWSYGNKKSTQVSYEDIISIENLLGAWREFLKGKRSRIDVQEFDRDLMTHILALHQDLVKGDYRHGGYTAF